MNFTHLDVDHLISSELSSSASYFMQLISNHLLIADSHKMAKISFILTVY